MMMLKWNNSDVNVHLLYVGLDYCQDKLLCSSGVPVNKVICKRRSGQTDANLSVGCPVDCGSLYSFSKQYKCQSCTEQWIWPKTEYVRSWKISEYQRPNIFVHEKFPNTEDRIVLFGPNYSRIPKNRSIRCNSVLHFEDDFSNDRRAQNILSMLLLVICFPLFCKFGEIL